LEELRYYATGRRKNATAKVWLAPGDGKITINGRDVRSYVGRQALEILILQPFEVTDTVGQYDVFARCLGGGIAGEAGAIRHGISRALLEVNVEFRPTLRRIGLLTRDPRVKDRKKYGRKRARRAFQFSKR